MAHLFFLQRSMAPNYLVRGSHHADVKFKNCHKPIKDMSFIAQLETERLFSLVFIKLLTILTKKTFFLNNNRKKL